MHAYIYLQTILIPEKDKNDEVSALPAPVVTPKQARTPKVNPSHANNDDSPSSVVPNTMAPFQRGSTRSKPLKHKFLMINVHKPHEASKSHM